MLLFNLSNIFVRYDFSMKVAGHVYRNKDLQECLGMVLTFGEAIASSKSKSTSIQEVFVLAHVMQHCIWCNIVTECF